MQHPFPKLSLSSAPKTCACAFGTLGFESLGNLDDADQGCHWQRNPGRTRAMTTTTSGNHTTWIEHGHAEALASSSLSSMPIHNQCYHSCNVDMKPCNQGVSNLKPCMTLNCTRRTNQAACTWIFWCGWHFFWNFFHGLRQRVNDTQLCLCRSGL